MLNRIARRGGDEAIEYNSLSAEIVSLLDSIKKRAQSDPLLALEAQKLEMPVTFFVDSIIAESNLRCAAEWHKNRIAYMHNELAGDEKFFDLLDETLNDPSPEASERLIIYFICIGLGFTGWYAKPTRVSPQKDGDHRKAHRCGRTRAPQAHLSRSLPISRF